MMAEEGGLEPYIRGVIDRVGLKEVWIIDDEFGRKLGPSDLRAALQQKDEGTIRGFCNSLGFDASQIDGGQGELIDELVGHCIDVEDDRRALESFLGVGEGGAEAFEHFWEACGEPCPIQRIRPNDAIEELEKVDGDAKGRLIVADLNLERAGMRKNDGARLLKQGLDAEDPRWGVLISHEFNGGREIREHEFAKVVDEVAIQRSSIVPIAKDVLIESDAETPVEIIILLLSALMVDERDELIEELHLRFEKGLQSTVHAIGELAPHEFAQAIVWSSSDDGTPPAETLSRILQSDYRRQVRSIIMQEDVREHLRRLGVWEPPIERELPSPEFPGVAELHRAQRLDSQDWLSQTNARLQLGDIFVSGAFDSPYLLLEQPCDLALRTDGNRNLRLGKVILLRPIPREESSREDGRYFQLEGLHGWPHLDLAENQIAILDFGKQSFVDLALLDCTTFSKDGKARIELEGDVDLTDGPLQERARALQRRVREKRDGSDSPQSFQESLDSNHNGSLSQLPIISPQASVDGDAIEFDIRRIGRLRREWATEALSAWANYKTRRAFPVSVREGLSI